MKRPPPRRLAALADLPPRPRRGRPADTRQRLLLTALEVFNRDGFHGTDTNRIAAAAGYSPGTMYKHFADKRALFLAAYEVWVDREWADLTALVGRSLPPAGLARAIVAQLHRRHVRWRRFRASLRLLVSADRDAQSTARRLRRRQLEWLRALRRRVGAPARSAERDALLLYSVERTLDAIADGETAGMGLSTAKLLAQLATEIATVGLGA